MTPPSAPSHLTTPAATEYCCVTARVPAFVPPCDVMLARPHEFGPFSYYHARGAAVPAHLQSRVKITSRHTHTKGSTYIVKHRCIRLSPPPTGRSVMALRPVQCSSVFVVCQSSPREEAGCCTLKYSFQYQQHIGSFAWATRLAVSCPHN